MTFKEYLVESALTEFSDEYFKVCQECYEIALSEQYLRNQMVMNESVGRLGLLESDIIDVQLESTFFTEAAASEELTAMYEGVKEKAVGVWKWIVGKAKWLVTTLADWLYKLAGVTKDQEATINELKEALGNTGLSPEEVSAELKKLKDELAKAQTDLKEAGLQIDIDRGALAQALRQKGAAEKSLADSESKVAALTKEGKEKQAEVDRLQKENQNLGKEITALHDVIDQNNEQIMALSCQVRGLKVKFSKLPLFCDASTLTSKITALVSLIESDSANKGASAASLKAELEKIVSNEFVVCDFSTNAFDKSAKALKDAGEKLAKYNPDTHGGSYTGDDTGMNSDDLIKMKDAIVYMMKVQQQTMSGLNALISGKTKSQRPLKSVITRLKNKTKAS